MLDRLLIDLTVWSILHTGHIQCDFLLSGKDKEIFLLLYFPLFGLGSQFLVIPYDAKGNLIYSIKKAARHYKRSNGRGGVNYSRICARYCIPRHTKKRASYRAGKGRKKTRKRSLF